jgi:hypothetical protein
MARLTKLLLYILRFHVFFFTPPISLKKMAGVEGTMIDEMASGRKRVK